MPALDPTAPPVAPPAPPGWFAQRRDLLPGIVALAVVAALGIVAAEAVRLTHLFGDSEQEIYGVYETFEMTPVLLVLVAALIDWCVGRFSLTWAIIAVGFGIAAVELVTNLLLLLTILARVRGNRGAFLLLLDAAALWLAHLAVFATWYWLLDGGGPRRRADRTAPYRPDFVFAPQQADLPGWEGWLPHYTDYIHVAFMISLTFSSGEVLNVARTTKWLAMAQALFALSILAVFIARAINILAA